MLGVFINRPHGELAPLFHDLPSSTSSVEIFKAHSVKYCAFWGNLRLPAWHCPSRRGGTAPRPGVWALAARSRAPRQPGLPPPRGRLQRQLGPLRWEACRSTTAWLVVRSAYAPGRRYLRRLLGPLRRPLRPRPIPAQAGGRQAALFHTSPCSLRRRLPTLACRQGHGNGARSNTAFPAAPA